MVHQTGQTRLLDDAAMRQFIVDGYLQVQADLPAAVHHRICRRIDAVLAKEATLTSAELAVDKEGNRDRACR